MNTIEEIKIQPFIIQSKEKRDKTKINGNIQWGIHLTLGVDSCPVASNFSNNNIKSQPYFIFVFAPNKFFDLSTQTWTKIQEIRKKEKKITFLLSNLLEMSRLDTKLNET